MDTNKVDMLLKFILAAAGQEENRIPLCGNESWGRLHKGGRSSFHSVTGIPVLKFQKAEGGSVLPKGLNARIIL